MSDEMKFKGSQTIKDFFAETLNHMVGSDQDSMEIDLKFPINGKNVTCTFEIALINVQED